MKSYFTLLMIALLLVSGCTKNVESAKSFYTCGMHPQVIQDHPGNCPICNMKLTPMNKEASATSDTIAIDPITIQSMGIRSELVTQGPLNRRIRTVGIIDYNETALADVTTKFRGWIVKLYVDSTGQQVHKGDPLFEIDSPELWSAQNEYLLALKQQGNSSLKNSALTKLKYYDISDAQIAEIEKSGQPTKTLRVNAPIDGVVVEKMIVAGQMVEAGMKLYRLADLSLVWVLSQIYEQDLSFIRLGQESVVSLSYLPESKFRGRVTYIYPNVDDKTRTAKIRMEFHNPGQLLKPGMFTTVDLEAGLSKSALLVPDSAVLRSGEKNTVFIALDGGKFEPRTVVLGARSENDRYQVLSGLKEGERVVTSGQFMLDSESQLREAIQKMQHPNSAELPVDILKTKAEFLTPEMNPTAPVEVDYVCPMPEHETLLHKAPGKCPLCGMTLIPVPQTSTLLPTSMPTPKLTLYTCPMPEHAQVVSDQPGECPKCGMNLVVTGTVKHGKIAEQEWAKQHQ